MSAVLAPHCEFKRERLSEIWDELAPLLRQHYDEIAHYKDIALDPDIERYNAMDAAGIFRAFIARVDGAIVGYAGFFVLPHLHYRSSLTANCDVIFVLPEYRHGRVSAGLFKFFKAELTREGVQMELQHIKAKDAPVLGPLFQRQGYEILDYIFVRRLD